MTHSPRSDQRVVVPLARVGTAPRIDLTTGVEIRRRVGNLVFATSGATITITVGDLSPYDVEPYTVEDIAVNAVERSLQVIVDGEPGAAEAWADRLRDLIAAEVLRGRR